MSKSPTKYALIGFACGAGAVTGGARRAPRVLRERDLIDRLIKCGADVSDHGDVNDSVSTEEEKYVKTNASTEEKDIKELHSVYWACKRLADKVRAALDSGCFPLIIGGDHSLSIGSIPAISDYYREQGKKIGLVWVDTHPDMNVPATSPSMNAFGMSAAVLTGRIPGILANIQKHAPAIELQNLAYIGLRDVDPGEREFIKKSNLAAFTTKEIDIRGMANVIDEAIAVATKDTAGFVVSYDVDVCDPWIAPGTGTRIRGGLNYREAHLVVELLYDSKKMLGFEMVELNPLLDTDHRTAELAISLFESAIGKGIL